jgi:hypothetical protein
MIGSTEQRIFVYGVFQTVTCGERRKWHSYTEFPDIAVSVKETIYEQL